MNFMLSRTMDVCLSVNEPIFMSLSSRDNGVERGGVDFNGQIRGYVGGGNVVVKLTLALPTIGSFASKLGLNDRAELRQGNLGSWQRHNSLALTWFCDSMSGSKAFDLLVLAILLCEMFV